jgi:sporulation protein YlmC with PRC-barrel domain
MSKAKLIGLGVAVAALAATPTFAQTGTSPPANRPATSAPSRAPARATLPSDIKSAKASDLIGKNVYSSTDERIGEIDDVVVSKSGGAPMAVIGVGGFLGIGEKKAAVSFDQLKVQGDKIVAAGLTKDSLKAQADYKSDDYSKYDRERVVGEAATGTTGGTSSSPSGGSSSPPAASGSSSTGSSGTMGTGSSSSPSTTGSGSSGMGGATGGSSTTSPSGSSTSPSTAPSNAPAGSSDSPSGSSTEKPKN